MKQTNDTVQTFAEQKQKNKHSYSKYLHEKTLTNIITLCMHKNDNKAEPQAVPQSINLESAGCTRHTKSETVKPKNLSVLF